MPQTPPTSPDTQRFLPTLTQVVQPDELAGLLTSRPALPSAQELFDSVIPHIKREIERQLALARTAPVAPPTLHDLQQRLLQQLSQQVRESVQQALANWPKPP